MLFYDFLDQSTFRSSNNVRPGLYDFFTRIMRALSLQYKLLNTHESHIIFFTSTEIEPVDLGVQRLYVPSALDSTLSGIQVFYLLAGVLGVEA